MASGTSSSCTTTYTEKAAEVTSHVSDQVHLVEIEYSKKSILGNHRQESPIRREGELIDAPAADGPASQWISRLFRSSLETRQDFTTSCDSGLRTNLRVRNRIVSLLVFDDRVGRLDIRVALMVQLFIEYVQRTTGVGHGEARAW